jgi:DUF4097 and DUF4098 domain-containing protein YvlB
MKCRLSLALAAALAGAGAVACDVRVSDKGVSLDINEGGRAEDEWTRSYTLAPGGRLEVHAVAGDIDIEPATGKAVDVIAKRQVHSKNDEMARDILAKLQMGEEVSTDRVRIEAVKFEARGEFGRRIRIDYRLRVPAGLSVTIRSEFGRVSMNGVDGRFAVASTNSRIEGKAVSGGLDLEMVNGGVVMQMAAVTADVRIRTVNGGIILDLPPGANATLEATTINGGVSVDGSLPLTAISKDRQRLSARLGAGSGPVIELNTTNGGVRLSGRGTPP